ncbi:MAG TPA: hypothetical protein VGD08_08405 [Stellaceae bacterium]|jgi:hypothetical protein
MKRRCVKPLFALASLVPLAGLVAGCAQPPVPVGGNEASVTFSWARRATPFSTVAGAAADYCRQYGRQAFLVTDTYTAPGGTRTTAFDCR